MVCIKSYKGIGYLKEDVNKSGEVNIKVGETIVCDEQGYLWKDNVCFGYKDATVGKNFKEAQNED